MTTCRKIAASIFAVLISIAATGQELEIDKMSGFVKTGDWELVRANCIACHSAKLVTQQRGSAAQWLALIRWMQAKQNLWQFDPEVEKKIVTYLADNYAPQEDRRRAALPPDQMPPNPYAPETSPVN
jgi:hypothetical protein